MLIVLTQDKRIIEWCEKPESGASSWGSLCVINEGSAPAASVILERYLKQVNQNEPLCIDGHGNNTEIGDENTSGPMSWYWGYEEFADYLNTYLPSNYTGPILFRVCSDNQFNFAYNTAKALDKSGKLNGVWLYGYDRGIDIWLKFPAPAALQHTDNLKRYQVTASVKQTA